MSVVGLFAGIGGFELAFERAGFDTTLMVEIEPAAKAVLRQHFPNVEIQDDVADLKKLPIGTLVLTAGFPCQNLSMAGDKAGINGAKSSIVGRMFDIIEHSNVPWVVVENVYFMLQLDGGRAMRWLIDQFERLRYRWAYRVLDTMGFGLPHRRRRVYLVASRDVDPRRVLFSDDQDTLDSPGPRSVPDLKRPLGFYWTEGRSGVGFTVDGIPPLKVGSSLGIPSAPAVLFPDGEVLTPNIPACERLQGFPSGWTSPEGVPNPGRAAWRMIGNAVSVPVAEWVARRIAHPAETKVEEGTPFDPNRRWPEAAWNVSGRRETVTLSDKPIPIPRPSISEFRTKDWGRLSDRALDGFIERAASGGLKMPAGFLDTLRKANRKPGKSLLGAWPQS